MSQLSESQLRVDERLKGLLGEYVRYLDDPGVGELSVNPGGAVFVSMAGNHYMVRVGDMPPDRVAAFVCAVASSLGCAIDVDRDATISGELPAHAPWRNGRFQGTLPPAAETATFTFRMHARQVYTLADYVECGILSEHFCDALVDALRRRDSIVVVGGTFSGKTTFLNALIDRMGVLTPDVRLVIGEDTREIQSSIANTKQLRTHGALTMTRLFENVMRERPDVFAIGEVRGPAAALLVRAINSGHAGGMCSLHAYTTRAALTMVESYASQGEIRVTRQEIAQAIDMIVLIEKDEHHPAGRVVRDVVRVRDELSLDGDYQLERV